MNEATTRWRMVRSILALFSLALISPSVWAQAEEADAEASEEETVQYFDEITVEAERTEKNILDTAMTITGFTSEMMQEFGIQDRDKLQILVPGLQFGENVDQQGNGISLRGIGTRVAGIEHHDRSVATYVDGAYTIGVYGVAPGGG
ncbi:MAG: TonB-dependent receptor plug domain-containing protein, partial [Planctomycetota bacterium]